MLDLESVRCFIAAADQGSFRAAAQTVHLSPAAFGDRIKRLEAELGVRLFVRSTRSIRITTEGDRFLHRARCLLEEEAHCRSAVLAETTALPFEVTIGTRFELGLSWLVPAISTLHRSRPERAIHLYFGGNADLLHRLHTRHIDTFVSSARISTAGLEHAPLHEESYVLVGATQYLRQSPLRSAEDARRHVLIDAHADLPLFRYFLDAVPARPAWSFARIERMGTIAAIRERVLRGAGVAVLPKYFVQKDLEKRRLQRVMKNVRLRRDVFRLVWRADHLRQAELRALAEELRQRPLQ